MSQEPCICANPETLEADCDALQGKLWVDAGFWGAICPGNAGNASVLQGLVQAGALGFKSFLSPSGRPLTLTLTPYFNPTTSELA